jgi:hypothetical protein
MARDFRKVAEMSISLGIEASTARMGPWPIAGDEIGFVMALITLWKSLQPGGHSKTRHQQFATI